MKKYLNIRYFMFSAMLAGIAIFLTAKSAIHEIEAFVLFLISAVFFATDKILSALGGEVDPNTHVKCPDCRELVQNDAKKCKHCGCNLTPQ